MFSPFAGSRLMTQLDSRNFHWGVSLTHRLALATATCGDTAPEASPTRPLRVSQSWPDLSARGTSHPKMERRVEDQILSFPLSKTTCLSPSLPATVQTYDNLILGALLWLSHLEGTGCNLLRRLPQDLEEKWFLKLNSISPTLQGQPDSNLPNIPPSKTWYYQLMQENNLTLTCSWSEWNLNASIVLWVLEYIFL